MRPSKYKIILISFYNFRRYSFWKVDYDKYPGEGEKLFMTKNLANGFTQRLESLRKNAFGTWGVYGEEPNLEIFGNI